VSGYSHFHLEYDLSQVNKLRMEWKILCRLDAELCRSHFSAEWSLKMLSVTVGSAIR